MPFYKYCVNFVNLEAFKRVTLSTKTHPFLLFVNIKLSSRLSGSYFWTTSPYDKVIVRKRSTTPAKKKKKGAEALSNGWKTQWVAVKEKAMREWAGVVGKTHGLQGENGSITNFSTELHSHCFPINAGWRELPQPSPPLSPFYHLIGRDWTLHKEAVFFHCCGCWLGGLCAYS